MDPVTTQYTSYNQRRLHYSFLFWACAALQFSGVVLSLFFVNSQTLLRPAIMLGLIGLSCGLMAFIAFRLHRLEVHYETLLRQIEDHWRAENIAGIQRAKLTQTLSSRKLVVLALACLGLGFCVLSLSQF